MSINEAQLLLAADAFYERRYPLSMHNVLLVRTLQPGWIAFHPQLESC